MRTRVPNGCARRIATLLHAQHRLSLVFSSSLQRPSSPQTWTSNDRLIPPHPALLSWFAGDFDLSSFTAAESSSGGFYHATDSSGHDYFFDACGAITKVTCEGSAVAAPVALQAWDGGAEPPTLPQDQCGALGAVSTQSCHSTNASALTCDYINGDGGRTVSIRYKCAAVAVPPTASQPDPLAEHYIIDFAGPGACAAAPESGGGGWGKTFLILFFVITLLYVGGGYGYNFKYRDLRGAEAVPQIEYWQQVPGLVRDGCVFAYEQSVIFIAYLNEKRQGGPADPGLKRVLADNEEGAESNTVYEESKA